MCDSLNNGVCNTPLHKTRCSSQFVTCTMYSGVNWTFASGGFLMFDWWNIERPIEICQLWQKSRLDIARKNNSWNETTPPAQSNSQCYRYLIRTTNSKSYHRSNIGNSVLTFLWWDRGWGHKYSYSHINTHLVHTLPLQRINASTIMIFLYFF